MESFARKDIAQSQRVGEGPRRKSPLSCSRRAITLYLIVMPVSALSCRMMARERSPRTGSPWSRSYRSIACRVDAPATPSGFSTKPNLTSARCAASTNLVDAADTAACVVGRATGAGGAFSNCEITSCGGEVLTRACRGCASAGISGSGFSTGLSCVWIGATTGRGRDAGAALIPAIVGSFAGEAGVARTKSGAG